MWGRCSVLFIWFESIQEGGETTMRALTSKQKKLLNGWYKEQRAKGKEFGMWWDVRDDEDFTGDFYELVDSINPCEIFNQNVNHYIHDLSDKE